MDGGFGRLPAERVEKCRRMESSDDDCAEAGRGTHRGVAFSVADSIRSIEKTLAENQRPVAVGIPGYILPLDTEASLFLKYPSR